MTTPRKLSDIELAYIGRRADIGRKLSEAELTKLHAQLDHAIWLANQLDADRAFEDERLRDDTLAAQRRDC